MYLHLSSSSSSLVKILAYYVQVLSLQLPQHVHMAFFSLFNLKISTASGVFGGICVLPRFDSIDLLAMQLATPFAMLLMLVILFVGGRVRSKRKPRSGERRRERSESRLLLLAGTEKDEENDEDDIPSVASSKADAIWTWPRLLRTCLILFILTFSGTVGALWLFVVVAFLSLSNCSGLERCCGIVGLSKHWWRTKIGS